MHDFTRLKPELDNAKDKSFIVYCSDQDCHDSEWVAKALLKLGYKRVSLFKGGSAEWRSAHLPIVPE